MALKTTIFDVGHGSSTLIETDRLNILFDLGMDTSNKKNPLNYIDKLDYLIISHPHWDHISGLKDMTEHKEPTILLRNKKIPIEYIEESRNSTDNQNIINAFNKYLDLNKRYNKTVSDEKSPSNSNNNGNVIIKNFQPKYSDIQDLNYYSITLFIEYDGFRIVLMGDNTISNINELLENNDFLNLTKDIDIFLAPHHGHESCYKTELINHINPKITIISDKNEDDNSAVDKYSLNSRGCIVFENNEEKERFCLTTRNDGDIKIFIEDGKMQISCGNRR